MAETFKRRAPSQWGEGGALKEEIPAAAARLRQQPGRGREDLLLRGLRVVENPVHATGNLAQVPRWDASGPPDCHALRTFHEGARQAGGEHDGLLVAAVVVVLEVNCLFVTVSNHLKS